MMPTILELFSGTGSIGRSFSNIGWNVVSLDRDPRYNPTICRDVFTWDYETEYPRGSFDFIWASPDCTQYSRARTTARTPRNLEAADRLVGKTLEIISFYQTPFAFENPESGLLKTRDIVQGIPYSDTSYCHYGYPYRKSTRIWHNLGDYLTLIPKCCVANPCVHISEIGKHPKSAQRGPGKGQKGGRGCTLDELHSIPEGLCDSIAESVDIHYIIKTIDEEIRASYNNSEEMETQREA